ncbi:MAG: NAD(P)-dependent glycerol-3-phosphate dehydrogenase [Verrucomicrobia bacterium]|nr:NAD(P)-dependent glycerol-3-phosphate dehydrogenase [Verrucomicrobiota bacterium]MBV8377638.1 NAD(P)-dependent glycerol-3-phosphate dehydrogenase [Verrucomicrobiota bacterium]
METISIIGGGGWGTALAVIIARNGHAVRLWVRRKDLAETLNRERINQQYLPGIALPKSVLVTNDLSETGKTDVVLFVTPSTALREIATLLAATSSIRSETILLSAVKGIEVGTRLRMSEILASTFPGHPIAVLSGPNHAVEVANFTPTATVIGASQEEIGKKLQRVISAKSFRAYTSPDILGIEVGGALKNIFAIAAGIADGLGLGDNSKAALVTRSLAEMARLGSALGGKRETFQGLSGAGDLIVTCFSRHSRNRRVGERIGRGERLTHIQSSMRMVAEGVPTARSARDCALRLAVTTPIIDEVNSILYENALPAMAMERLISRAFRPEED